ncbi:TetR/AcrR family transcriptional regulator [Nocardia cyriacigeorgica]|uniref:TetR/AcrR family transcriptional regulator n=1 Tax=Nocardia cyriacigeorgica TaxID=135487 RepID=UPI00189482A3|nr:TetR/AcrR family transcriptional regulator [Nocardia cyriacigeorgica]MBF6414486.1 TetR/AcrR family transcriptional regulator [Nocardia cyriacigeorgica]
MNLRISQSVPRGRSPVITDADIRRAARQLLVEHGADSVTLRAIARSLGVTAPALYRYYKSLDDLMEALRLEICADLAAELSDRIAELPDDGAVQFFAICQGFRHWALAHTREFTLVFASPGAGRGVRGFDEPFGRIFLAAAGRLLATYDVITPPADDIPDELRADLQRFQAELLGALAEAGQPAAADRIDLGVTYLMIQIWARLYGHVTLEVFGNYPVPLSNPEVLFDAMLADLGRSAGLIPG